MFYLPEDLVIQEGRSTQNRPEGGRNHMADHVHMELGININQRGAAVWTDAALG